ncbi:esterase [Devosia pacifica]|uniref:Esterase n=1 Tax=Devosia pacifica TaxID=1335967 RepID=A0A918S2V2_9HYPH|nr:alpha/beta hydrolase [Devosia pacifica]GHA21705.1 esterase [Devosia pacifica]
MTKLDMAQPTKAALWRGMGRPELDIAYDNTGAVAASGNFIADWTRRSAALRARMPELIDLAYGPGERNKVDIFRCGLANAPLLVFIHGGYWQRNSKEVFSCMAEGVLAAGIDVAVIGYTLAPKARLTQIKDEVATALDLLRTKGANFGVAKNRLVVSGWSAGGHLAATALSFPAVDAGLAISGIFDLEPIRLGGLNDKLGLTEADVEALSPIHTITRSAKPLVVAYGTGELPELQRQSQEYARAWQQAKNTGRALPLSDEDHFSILEQLAQPGGMLSDQVIRLARDT